MNSAVIFGAGNIGRGFIGQLFSDSNLQVQFVDVDSDLLGVLNTDGSYELEAVVNNDCQRVRIGPVSGIQATDLEQVATAVAEAEIAATAVGVRVLPAIATALARGIEARRKQDNGALNILLCENMKGASEHLRALVETEIGADSRSFLSEQVGFVDTVIGRMVPPPTAEMRAENPGLIRVEPYRELPVDRKGFRGSVPAIVDMTAHENFELFTARKLYIHNCGHAVLGYAGWHRHLEFGWQAVEDPAIREHLFSAWEECRLGLMRRYNAKARWLQEHMQQLFGRFRNRALGDTTVRLCRDPIRKLGPADRIVAPARLAEAAGRVPEALATTIAGALRFAAPDDPVAQDLQRRLNEESFDGVLPAITEIQPGEALGALVEKMYTAPTATWRDA